MKRFMALLGAVTVICIILGTYIHVGGFLMNIFGRPIFSFGSSAKEESFSEDYSGVEKIDMDMAVGDVVLKEGSSFNVTYSGHDDLKPEVKLENGNLRIKQKKNIKIKTVNLGNIKCNLTITVPSNTTLKEMEANLDMGDLKISDLACKKLEAELAMGNLEIKKAKAEKITADCKMGDCKILESAFDELKGNCDMGNVHVKLTDSVDNYGIEAKVDMGDVKIDGRNEGNEYNSKGDKTMDLKVDMGNITVE